MVTTPPQRAQNPVRRRAARVPRVLLLPLPLHLPHLLTITIVPHPLRLLQHALRVVSILPPPPRVASPLQPPPRVASMTEFVYFEDLPLTPQRAQNLVLRRAARVPRALLLLLPLHPLPHLLTIVHLPPRLLQHALRVARVQVTPPLSRPKVQAPPLPSRQKAPEEDRMILLVFNFA